MALVNSLITERSPKSSLKNQKKEIPFVPIFERIEVKSGILACEIFKSIKVKIENRNYFIFAQCKFSEKSNSVEMILYHEKLNNFCSIFKKEFKETIEAGFLGISKRVYKK